jgi:hypothetical protein
VAGPWSIKDIVAQLTGWRRREVIDGTLYDDAAERVSPVDCWRLD